MNGKVDSTRPATILRPRSTPVLTNPDGEAAPVDDGDTFSDPLGLCPLGVKSTRVGTASSGTNGIGRHSTGELNRARDEISDILDNWSSPEPVSKSPSTQSDTSNTVITQTSITVTTQIESYTSAVDSSKPLPSVDSTGPVVAVVSERPVEATENKQPFSSEYSVPVAITATVPQPSSQKPLLRTAETTNESKPVTAVQAEDTLKQTPTRAPNVEAAVGVPPAKLSNFGRAADPNAGHKKNAGDAGKTMDNFSIHFSKKAMFEDSDSDEGMGIAISVKPPPMMKEALVFEKSSSVESVTETMAEPVPMVDNDVIQAAKVVPCSNDVYSTPKIANGDATPASEIKSSKPSADRKRKGWYSRQRAAMLSATYKSKSVDYKRIFKDIPTTERLIVDYSCALQRDILCHGRMYVSRDWFCFYANIFRWETAVMIRTKDIVKLTKERTALVIPNAISITTSDDKTYFFASFATREKSFLILDRVRKCAVEEQPMSQQEMWQWIHYNYGEDLGLTDHDDDYVPLTSEEKIDFQTQVQQKLLEQSTEGLPTAGSSADLSSAELDPSIIDAVPVAGTRNILPSDSSNDSAKNVNILADEAGSKDDDDDVGLSSDVEDSSEGQKDGKPCEMCSGHDHFDVLAVDEILNIPVDTVFQYIFTDSATYRNYLNSRKTFDVTLPPWPAEADATGIKVRNISYTLTLNNAIGPKTSASTERQIMQPQSRPGEFYLIDTECINSQVPYGENFYVVTRYCISRVTTTTTRLRITGMIKYRKAVWGFVKNIIDKNVTAGIIEAYNALADVLKLESNRNAPRKRPVRHRIGSSRAVTVPGAPEAAAAVRGKHEETRQSMFTVDVLVRVLCVLLVTLMLFNTFLMYKLWSVESRTYDQMLMAANPPTGPEHSTGGHAYQSDRPRVDTVKLLDEISSLLAELKKTVASSYKAHCEAGKCPDQL